MPLQVKRRTMVPEHILWTGQVDCFDTHGQVITCDGAGQDAAAATSSLWPEPRFVPQGEGLVVDRVTRLLWPKEGCPVEFPLSWQEGLDHVEELRRQCALGRDDWRLPNRRELRSLIDHSQKMPALPRKYPFVHAAIGWYWTSTTAAIETRYAWYLHLEGGRMFYGNKQEYHWILPVAGESPLLPRTGSSRCYDERGGEIVCDGSGQDGALQKGVGWPQPRFVEKAGGVLDRLTGLIWHREGRLNQEPTTWAGALEAVAQYGRQTGYPFRLPTINELESLIDASRYEPALPESFFFPGTMEAYWSSTTSGFAPDWAYVLYLHKGAVGVGFKANRDFHIWPVMTDTGGEV